jgi:hypothetical protein
MAKKKDNKNKPKKQAKTDIYDAFQTLGPKQMKRFVNAITQLEYKPQIQAIQQEVNTLGGMRDSEVNRLNTLGTQAQGNIQSYYRSLAEAEAGNLARQQAMNQRVGEEARLAGQQGAQQISQAASAAESKLNPNSSARETLQSMIAQQSTSQARESEAAQQALAAQGQNWQGLAQAMASANQGRGGENVSATARQNLADITSSQSKYNDQITKLLSEMTAKKREAALGYLKNLYDIRGSEREYDLGLKAVDAKSAYNSLQRWQTKQNLKNDAAQRKNSVLLAGIYGQQKTQSQASQMALAELYTSDSTKRWREAYRILQGDSAGAKQLIKNKQKAIAMLVKKHSFTEAEAIKAMNLFQKKYKKAQGKSGSGSSGAPH